MMHRRDLLKSLVLAPLAGQAAVSLRWLPGGDSRCLIVLELEGGNDGLAMLIPKDDAVLPRVRKTLASVRKGALDLAPGFALHPALRGVHGLCTSGLAAFVHAVGYPRPDRSHFRSRDIWHTADPSYTKAMATTSGWLGRAADQLAERGAAIPALSVGSLGVPLALRGRRVVVPSIERIEDYQVIVDPSGGQERARQEQLVALARAAEAGDPPDPTAFLAAVGKAAVDNAERLRTSLRGYVAKAEYPETALAKKAQLLARMLTSGFGTRLFHVSFGGFDTHARQLPTQESLLRILDGALTALVRDLEGHGALDEVTILVHSEFGRRVAENASLGTDHGAAAPVLLLGKGLQGPLLGEPPSLVDLDDGDLKMRVDFRSIYAALLARLGVAAQPVLPGPIAPFAIFA